MVVVGVILIILKRAVGHWTQAKISFVWMSILEMCEDYKA